MASRFKSESMAGAHLPLWFGWWLVLLFVMIVITMQIGAATRLTDSGLSMVEWRPLMGTVPPLTAGEWQRVFSLYQGTAEYRSYPIDLSSFKTIFWWEYVHRTWGRLIGLVAIVPFIWLLWHKLLNGWWIKHLGAVIALGALQGGVGYWMVLSGLRYRVDVASERLVVHLFIAVSILFYLAFLIRKVWVPVGKQSPVSRGKYLWVWFTSLWVLVLALSGVLVAGLDAGYVYNTFPLMGDRLIAEEYGSLTSGIWSLIFDDAVAAQVHHRFLGVSSFVVVGIQTFLLHKCGGSLGFLSKLQLGLLVVQGALGVATLLSVVSLTFALLHQLGAIMLLLLSFFIWLDTHLFEDVARKVE